MAPSTPKGDYLAKLAKVIARSKSDAIPAFTVADLVSATPGLSFGVAGGHEGMHRQITAPKVQLLGLALAGFTDDLVPGSVQMLGQAELRFIEERISQNPPAFFDPEFEFDLGCFAVPKCLSIPEVFIRKANKFAIPVLRSPKSFREVEDTVVRILEEALAPTISFHGELVVVCGLGILIIGQSGIGKTDCALDLIAHGHQLVADDVVSVRLNPMGRLVGKAKESVKHHMNIRGLGIVNIKELFSVYSVMEEHTIDMAILLEPWAPDEPHALAPEEQTLRVLELEVPLYHLPVATGRNWLNLIQVAVRKFILQTNGYDAEQILAEKLSNMLNRGDVL